MGPEHMTGDIHYLEVSINRSSFVQYFYNSQGNGLNNTYIVDKHEYNYEYSLY